MQNYQGTQMIEALRDIANELGNIGAELRRAREAREGQTTDGTPEFPLLEWQDPEAEDGTGSVWHCYGTPRRQHPSFMVLQDTCPVAECGGRRDAF